MMWNVKPGDLVVFVERFGQRNNRDERAPEPLADGEIYTVYGTIDSRGEIFLQLQERPKPVFGFSRRPGWHIGSFRPVTKPDIENLRSLINKPDLVEFSASLAALHTGGR